MRDAAGAALPATRCTTTPEGDVTWIRLSVPAETPRGVVLGNAVLFEAFADQINIVQSSVDGRSRTVLFTRGDAAKALT